MKQRCLDPSGKDFEYYGGRGITIFPEWINDYGAFLAHVGRKPSPQHSLDRTDNSLGYFPGNVRWASRAEQANNRRPKSTAMTEYKAVRDKNRAPSHPGDAIEDILVDVRVTRTQIASRLGISRQHLHDILSGHKPLSPAIAVKVAALFGGSAESWLRMQATHDAWRAAKEVDVSRIKRLEVA